MAVQIQLRRGTSLDWSNANPILANGEIGVETDTYRFKIGNGVANWSSLNYFTQIITGSTYPITSSWSNYSTSASYSISSSFASTASYANTLNNNNSYTIVNLTANNISASGNITSSASNFNSLTSVNNNLISITSSNISSSAITSSLFGTSSYSNNSTSASYSLSGSYSNFAKSGSYSLTSSYAESSSYSITSSFSSTASYIVLAQTASYLNPISQSLIPSTSSTYSLGSATNKWKDLYVSTGSIYIGDFVLNATNLNLLANGSPIVTYNTSSGQIQVSGSVTGLSSSFSSTSSYVVLAQSSSYLIPQNNYTVSNLTASNISASGQIIANSFTGSLLGTSSYSNNSTSASYSLSGSYVNFARSSSYSLSSSYTNTSSYAESASYSVTSSYSTTSSYVVLAQTASFVSLAQTASYVNLAQTASYVTLAQTASSLTPQNSYTVTNLNASNSITTSNAIINGNLTVSGSILASIFSASNIYITSSQLVVTDNIITLNALSPYQRYAGIEMYDSGSGALSSILWDSVGDYFFISGSGINSKIIGGPDGQLNLTSGKLTKATGSNIIGDSIVTDNGSGIIVSGYISSSGQVNAGGFTGSLFGTSSWSNNSLSASYFGSGSDNYFPVWSSNKLSFNSLISQSNNQVSILSNTASFLGNTLIINKSDPFYVNNNPTIDASNSPNQTLMLTPNIMLGGNGNGQNWNRFNSDGTVDFLGSNIKFTTGGSAAFNSKVTIGSLTLLGNNALDVIGNISASVITSSRLFGTADTASYYGGSVTSASYSSTSSYSNKSVSSSYASTVAGGTVNYIPLWTGTTTLSSSNIYQSGSNGYIGIGTTLPSAKLDIRQTLAATGLKVFVNDTTTANIAEFIGYDNVLGDTTRMVVQAGGNVGIGTTSPSYKLDVVNATINTIRIQNTANTLDAYLITQNTLGTTFFGINSTGGYIYNSSAIPISFYTNTSERMRIAGDGNVGIGTSSPADKLHVIGNIRINGGDILNWSGQAFIQTIGANDMFFRPNSTLKMILTAGGNLGIGDSFTSPTYLLDVSGSSRHGYRTADNHYFTGSVSISGSTTSFGSVIYKNAVLLDYGSTTAAATSSNYAVLQNITGSYNSAFFDYFASSGSNFRAGTIVAGWSGNTINYTEYSTTDTGNTNQLSMSVDLSGSYVRLLTNVSTTINWNIKSSGRYL